MAALSLPEWGDLPDDSKWIFEAMARLDLQEFGALSTSDQQVVVALAVCLKSAARRAQVYQA